MLQKYKQDVEMMYKTLQKQSKKAHNLSHTKLPQPKMAKVSVSIKLLKLMFLSSHCPPGFSAGGWMYYLIGMV